MLGTGKGPRLVVAFLAAAALACAISACGVAQDGPHEVRSRQVGQFSRIEVHGSTEVAVRPGRGDAVRVEGGTNRVNDLTTRIEGRTLVVEMADSSATIDLGDDPARVVAEAPRIEAVRIDGSGRVDLDGMRGPRLGAAIYGSGEVRARGQVERLSSRIDGSGALAFASLRADQAAVDIAGKGAAELGATDRLDAEIHSSGSVTYAGHPTVSEEISGSGRIQPR
jgi:putative autotransporter adhesin-like protein